MTEEVEITTVSEKGQVVIPQSLRRELGIGAGTKFLVFGKGDTVIMKKLRLPDVEKEWKEIFKAMDEKRLKLSDEDVQKEVTAVRRGKRRGK
ncbi:MAG: AbrB/MazE/SpoVT family DNA-binding domain-containing protein [Nitrososphaerota archaeon]|nr:AbrB/MazE/SpoVT family DNA-binding domain-containing protein [Nitrososphaerota archaeon]